MMNIYTCVLEKPVFRELIYGFACSLLQPTP
jgi:hypothetical protein